MEMTLNNGFCEMTGNEMLAVDGGDYARQKMVAAHRASGNSLGSTKMAVNAQATVTGWGVSLIGVALAIPTGGASLAFSLLGAGIATAGICSL